MIKIHTRSLVNTVVYTHLSLGTACRQSSLHFRRPVKCSGSGLDRPIFKRPRMSCLTIILMTARPVFLVFFVYIFNHLTSHRSSWYYLHLDCKATQSQTDKRMSSCHLDISFHATRARTITSARRVLGRLSPHDES